MPEKVPAYVSRKYGTGNVAVYCKDIEDIKELVKAIKKKFIYGPGEKPKLRSDWSDSFQILNRDDLDLSINIAVSIAEWFEKNGWKHDNREDFCNSSENSTVHFMKD